MDHRVTARLAHADTTKRYPANGRYHMAVVTIRYSQSTWSCSHRSGCHRLPPRTECARTEMMKAMNSVAMSAAMKYTSGMAINPVNSFSSTLAVSEMGSDFQNSTLRSLRSA